MGSTADRAPARGDPGWPARSRLPGALETLAYLADPTRYLALRAARDGSTFGVRTLMYGDQVFVADPADLGDLFAADPDVLRAGEANTVLRRVVGARSVSSLDGEAHRERRRLLGPALQAARPPGGWLRSLVHRELGSLPVGRPAPLRPRLRRITLAAMLATLFGSDDDGDALGATFARLVDRGAVPFAQLGAIPALQRDLGPWSPWGAFARDLALVDGALRARVARRRASPPRCPPRAASPGSPAPADRPTPRAPADVLGALLASRDQAGQTMSDDDLRDDLFTLLGAGHETSATALAWAIEDTLSRPALAARLRRELSADPDASPLLDATLRESLRLHPVLPTVTRRLAAPFALGGLALPAGTDLVLCLYLAQRSPRHLDQPGEFRPERFLDARRDALPWWPFGGGTRRCPGLPLAWRQLRTVVTAALTSFDLSLALPRPGYPLFRGSTLAPAGETVVVRRG